MYNTIYCHYITMREISFKQLQRNIQKFVNVIYAHYQEGLFVSTSAPLVVQDLIMLCFNTD